MAGYCRCGILLYRGREGLCDDCYPLSRTKAEREDRAAELEQASREEERGDATSGD